MYWLKDELGSTKPRYTIQPTKIIVGIREEGHQEKVLRAATQRMV